MGGIRPCSNWKAFDPLPIVPIHEPSDLIHLWWQATTIDSIDNNIIWPQREWSKHIITTASVSLHSRQCISKSLFIRDIWTITSTWFLVQYLYIIMMWGCCGCCGCYCYWCQWYCYKHIVLRHELLLYAALNKYCQLQFCSTLIYSICVILCW